MGLGFCLCEACDGQTKQWHFTKTSAPQMNLFLSHPCTSFVEMCVCVCMLLFVCHLFLQVSLQHVCCFTSLGWSRGSGCWISAAAWAPLPWRLLAASRIWRPCHRTWAWKPAQWRKDVWNLGVQKTIKKHILRDPSDFQDSFRIFWVSYIAVYTG